MAIEKTLCQVAVNRDLCGAQFYSDAKTWVLDKGFAPEIAWQREQHPSNVSESAFLREAAWVVYCSGFREATVRKHFDYLSLCFFDWSSAAEIAENASACTTSAMLVLANRPKHQAVARIAQHIAEIGYEEFKGRFLQSPLEVFTTLPFLGPITSVHLAKNLGFDVAKPDRHLVRLKDFLGYKDVGAMCTAISSSCGDPVRVIDLVLWRYIEQTGIWQSTKTPALYAL